MNKMIEFAKDNRTTDYFENFAINQIKIAYRVMEYLAPDEIFKPKVDKHTKELILTQMFSEAYDRIFDESSILESSSLGWESLRKEAIELMQYLLPIYIKDCKDATEKRRIELLDELREIDNKV